MPPKTERRQERPGLADQYYPEEGGRQTRQLYGGRGRYEYEQEECNGYIVRRRTQKNWGHHRDR